jgi:hypothetical protein
MKSRKVRFKYLLLAFLIIGGTVVLPPVFFLSKVFIKDPSAPYHEKLTKGYVDDASRMDRTAVDSILIIPTDSAAAIRQLIGIVKYADSTGKKISLAGSRHSMGGHTIYPGGIQIDMLPFHKLHLDEGNKVLYAQAGAKWSEIIPFLNRRNLSVAVMQSNNSFSVGGSVSVNCHGWQNNSGPIASTVQGFSLLKADGEIVHCSRTENAELFGLVLGGYGLFGIILEVELKVVPNRLYLMKRYMVPYRDYIKTYSLHAEGRKEVEMAYGRLDICTDNFLKDAILNVFIPDTT